jgi:PAS domain-containing protein
METGQPQYNIEEHVQSECGTQIWVLTNKLPLFDSKGCVSGLLGISREITERKELETKNQQLATLVESSEDAIVGMDLERRITLCNAGTERLYGYSAEELIGAPTSILIPA